MARRTQTLIVASTLSVVLALIGLWLPVPFVTLAPGPVTDTLGMVDGNSLIQINGRGTYPTDGRLELTTVEETPQLNLLGALRDWLDSERAVVPRELVQPPGTSQEQIQQENTQAMLDSQDQATAAALTELGVKPTGPPSPSSMWCRTPPRPANSSRTTSSSPSMGSPCPPRNNSLRRSPR
jgi:PDZ domain-containing protein